MGGKPKPSNDRLVFVLPRVVVAWIDVRGRPSRRHQVCRDAWRGATVPLAAVISARRGGR